LADYLNGLGRRLPETGSEAEALIRSNTQVIATKTPSDNSADPAPLPNLQTQNGYQLAAVTALHPLSTERLAAQHVPLERAASIGWPAGKAPVRT
jgi:hypothetical protein